MATPVRIKRSTGSSAPASLLNAELAYAEGGDGVLYIGVGSGGANGTATNVVQIAGAAIASTITTTRAPNLVFAGPSSGSNAAPTFRSLVASDIPDISGTYLTTSSASSTYLTQSTATSTYAPLASPSLSGVPTSPTASAGTSSTQIATTAFVSTAISNLVNGAGSALDTLAELATALGNDSNFSTTITTSIGGKLAKASNLSDLTDASAARANLGLGTMATQAASNVAITGGTIDGVTIDCGTF